LLSTFCTLKQPSARLSEKLISHERPESVLESELVGCSLVLARLSEHTLVQELLSWSLFVISYINWVESGS